MTAAQAVAEYAESKGVQIVRHLPKDPSAVQSAAATATLRAASGKQPRGKKFPELIPEFKAVQRLEFDMEAWSRWNLAVGDRI